MRTTEFIKMSALFMFFVSAVFVSSWADSHSSALPVTEALDIKTINPTFTYSPDERQIVFGVRNNRALKTYDFQNQEKDTGIPWYAMNADLLLLDVKTGETTSITQGIGSNWGASWSPDGRYVAFFADRDNSGRASLWVWLTETKTLRKISSDNLQPNAAHFAAQLQWTPDSRKLIVPTRTVPDSVSVISVGSEESVSDKANLNGIHLYGGTAAQPLSAWDIGAAVRDLVSIDVATGETHTLLHAQAVTSYRLAPDGQTLALTVLKRFEQSASQQMIFDLVVLDLGSSQEKILATNLRLPYAGNPITWSADSHYIAYSEFGDKETVGDVFVADVPHESVKNISSFSHSISQDQLSSAPPLWTKDGTLFFIRGKALWKASVNGTSAKEVTGISGQQIVRLMSVANSNLWCVQKSLSTIVIAHDDATKQDAFYEINLETGALMNRMTSVQCLTCSVPDAGIVLPKSQQFIYMGEDSQHPPDAWIADANLSNHQRLTLLNPQFEKYSFGKSQLIRWLNDDGIALRGVLMLPPGYKEGGEPLPLVTFVYGGLSLSNQFNRFYTTFGVVFNMQLYATRGYAVFLPDAPIHTAKQTLDLVKDVLPGINKVIEMGVADPSRLGVMGHSNGGFSVAALITHTSRFKAAVEIAGIADETPFYGEMDPQGAAFGMSVEEADDFGQGGPPWQLPLRYFENSPVFYLDQVQTPVLIIHGASDHTVEPFLGDELFVDLRRLGKEVDYVKYEGEGHALSVWSFAHQVDVCNRMIAWFDDHLRR